ncbi:MAG: hypothetical protein EOO11_05845 [Chitinophagaceae bacterium]|nr:MAG: hypothetical protein EOO11_05845 [Chitinophagaceae bacterium]
MTGLPTPDPLRQLIALCEEEQARLQALIRRCVAEEEYLMAHQHSEAASMLNGKLQTLYPMRDPHHSEKEMKRVSIGCFERELSSDTPAAVRACLEEVLREKRAQLPHLKRHLREQTLTDDMMAQLATLGFHPPASGSRLEWRASGTADYLFAAVQEALSRLVFDVLCLSARDGGSYVEFSERRR